jgi:hypothetical protein
MRWRRRGHRHLGRAPADGPDGDHHHIGGDRNFGDHLVDKEHVHLVLQRRLVIELRVGFVRQREQLIRNLVGRQHERREHGRWRHGRWRELDGPEPARRRWRWRHA